MTDVSKLEGAELDAAVASAQGLDADLVRGGYTPSTRWHDGGPIIELEGISIFGDATNGWEATYGRFGCECYGTEGINATGPTPLIAAMRAYVASKQGR